MTDTNTDPATTTIAGGAEDVNEPEVSTTPDEGGEAEGTAVDSTSEPTAESGTGDDATAPPAEYNLTIPDGVEFPEGYADSMAEFAKEHNLSPDVAQAMVNRQAKAAQEAQSAYDRAIEQEHTKWVEAVKADSELGGENFDQSQQLARKVVNRFASEELIQELNETGLGNHPELVRLLVRIGRSMSDDTLVTGKTTSSEARKERSAEEIFYGGEGKE